MLTFTSVKVQTRVRTWSKRPKKCKHNLRKLPYATISFICSFWFFIHKNFKKLPSTVSYFSLFSAVFSTANQTKISHISQILFHKICSPCDLNLMTLLAVKTFDKIRSLPYLLMTYRN